MPDRATNRRRTLTRVLLRYATATLTQQQIVELLRCEGHEVTQPTVSRDLTRLDLDGVNTTI